ncbi:MAG TPA: SDR family NAD(P)-dependent oxidoreductase [Bauldia sp.]|nr:SDR family NAD(P)-dependent oxidoreductase [Bauldia sp.]
MAAAGRRAVVTGGGRGIGRAVAAALTRSGLDVTVLGRSAAALEDVVAAGEAAACRVADVTDEAALSAILGDLNVDILVNNAGIADSAPFARSDLALFRRLMTVNFESVVTAARAVLPGMLARGFGRIVSIASVAGLKGYPYVTAYCASKHAVVGLTRALAQEVARSGVTVNAICPGYVDTDLVRDGAARVAAKTGRPREEITAAFHRHNPQGRLITVEEVAGAVVWLASDEAAAVNGQAIAIDGGETP